MSVVALEQALMAVEYDTSVGCRPFLCRREISEGRREQQQSNARGKEMAATHTVTRCSRCPICLNLAPKPFGSETGNRKQEQETVAAETIRGKLIASCGNNTRAEASRASTADTDHDKDTHSNWPSAISGF